MTPLALRGAAITAALRATGGNVTRAALALGCTPRVLHYWLRSHPEARPVECPALRAGRPPLVTDAAIAAIAAALIASGGNVAIAARGLGCAPDALHKRLRTHPEARPRGCPVLRGGRPRTATDASIVTALIASGGSLAAAGRALGVSPSAIGKRVALPAFHWPAGVPRRRVGAR